MFFFLTILVIGNKMKILLKILLIGALSIVQICCDIVENKFIESGKPYQLKNPLYPNADRHIIVEWNLEVENDAKIRLVCNDIRMVQYNLPDWTPDCPQVYLNIIDGDNELKICNDSITNYVYKSIGRHLKVKLVTTEYGRGILRCTAMSTADLPNAIKIPVLPNGRPTGISISTKTLHPRYQVQFNIESPPGTRTSLKCNFGIIQSEPCGENVLIYNNGENDQEFCDSKKHIWISKSNRSKLRFHWPENGGGWLDCIAQAITGPNEFEFNNIPASPAVDSSEHGVTRGVRTTSCDCGRANKRRGRIVYGSETNPNEFPWLVELIFGLAYNESAYVGLSCGGTIITARHILSAAHCVTFENETQTLIIPADSLEIRLGKHADDFPTGHEITIGAEKIYYHEKYIQGGITEHDIVVILTNQKIDFSTPYISPVCIEPEYIDVFHKHLTIIGRGLDENYDTPYHVRKGKTLVVDNLYCLASSWEICTALSPSNTCPGDSGGPYVFLDPETNRYTQISVTSRPGTGEEIQCKNFGVSVLVSYYYNWIQEVIRSSDPSVRTCHKI